ncbi:hypothetical protein ETC03_29695, partial [Geobacillus sp. MMMUD3]|nr:hypothetical protein [Geobacillus sp. MMMUD3]
CEKLRQDQRHRLDDILEEYPVLSIAYYLKELFRDFYRTDGYNSHFAPSRRKSGGFFRSDVE